MKNRKINYTLNWGKYSKDFTPLKVEKSYNFFPPQKEVFYNEK